MGQFTINGGTYNRQNLLKKDKDYLVDQCLGLKKRIEILEQRLEAGQHETVVIGTDFMPAESNKRPIYSKRIIFTVNGTEYKGWVRFDFQEFISEGKHSFEYKEIESWRYDPEYQ